MVVDFKAFLQDKTILPIIFADSTFIDNDHQYIVTRDLRMVRNNNLRKLFTMGPTYGKTNDIPWGKAKFTIIEWLYDYIDTRCSKHGSDISVLLEWNWGVTHKIDENIKSFSNKTYSKIHKGILQQNNPQNILNDIHGQCVFTPIDKANGKVSLLVKNFMHLFS